MNKRQKKKLYKKKTGHNPPKTIKHSHEIYRMGVQEGKTFLEALREWTQPFREQLREVTRYLTNTYNTVNTAKSIIETQKEITEGE